MIIVLFIIISSSVILFLLSMAWYYCLVIMMFLILQILVLNYESKIIIDRGHIEQKYSLIHQTIKRTFSKSMFILLIKGYTMKIYFDLYLKCYYSEKNKKYNLKHNPVNPLGSAVKEDVINNLS